MPTNTTAVTVTFTLDSSIQAPPFEVSNCQGTITYNDNTPALSFSGWNAEQVAPPQAGGAAFTLNVVDQSYSPSNATSILNWAVTFIPRSPTSAQSPFGNNQNTITGTGSTNNNGTFTLNLGNVKIRNTGDWDWALMVQVATPVGVKCFSSDPEMEVGT